MGSNYRIVGWVALFAVSGLVASCSDRSGDSQALPSLRGCYADDQCATAEKCVFRLCSPSCDADRRCSDGAAQCVESGRGPVCIRVQDNACIDDSDCPQDSACENKRCTNLCEPDGGMSCQPDAGTPAGEGGAGGRTSTGGRGGAGGRAGAGGSGMMCPAGSVQCRDNAVVRCTSDGRAERQETCPFACRDGACTGSCRPDEVRCNGRARERCGASGSWTAIETCRNTCTPSACTDTCMDGARTCDGNAVIACRGGRQFQLQRCDYLCRAGMCAGSCTPGTVQCRDNAVVTCNADGEWGMAMACSNACVGNACTGECMPGSQRCGSNTSYQICNSRGLWTNSIECRSGACVDGECTGVCEPGLTRCESDSALATCGADGQWSGAIECPGQACRDGECAGTCLPESRRCLPNDGLQPQVCDAQGLWQNEARCEPDRTCVDGTCSGECIPTARRCDPGNSANYQVCDAGSMWGAALACGDAMGCVGDGVCETMQACAPGQTPEWYGMGDGVNRGLYDPRWGGPTDSFATGTDPSGAGYAIVYDRASNELAVTVRIDVEDVPTAADFVYFAVANEDGTAGRAARIEITASNMGMGMGMGMDPRSLGSVDGYELRDGTWSDTARIAWLQHTTGWLDSADVAWAVSFRVSLESAELDPASSIRLAIGAHVDSEAGELNWTTPTQLPLDPSMVQARFFTMVNLAELGCAARVTLP